jgi:RimJ/RimL family protein N-acetyltransferase
MDPAPRLTDGVVRLRRWRAADAAALHRVVNDSLDHLAAWLPWAAGGYSEADAVEFLRSSHNEWRDGEAFNYASVTADNEIVGSCGLMSRIGPDGLEIGYWIGKRYTGRGLATRAAALLTDEAFRIGAVRVEIKHLPGNLRSGAVPRRLGFTSIGPDDAGYLVWRLLAQ